jgi:hypothetical protein
MPRKDRVVGEQLRYRRVSTRMWGDEKFRRLSAPKPNGRSLWLLLVTGPQTSPVPGLFHAGQAALAEELGWPLPGFQKAWREIEQLEMAIADWTARVVWIPKAIPWRTACRKAGCPGRIPHDFRRHAGSRIMPGRRVA